MSGPVLAVLAAVSVGVGPVSGCPRHRRPPLPAPRSRPSRATRVGASRWQNALRAERHDHHQRHAEDQQPAVAEAAEPLGQVGDEDATDDHAPPVAGAADDDRRDEQDRQLQREARRG